MSFSPSSSSRSGGPSAFSSDDIAAGIQYCRISSPITVPGPTRVSSPPSVAVVISALLQTLFGFRQDQLAKHRPVPVPAGVR